MPMPLSDTVMVLASALAVTVIFSSPSSSSNALLFSASKRSLSQASAALEISSRKKISLLEYKEWIISCNNCLTSV